MHILCYSAELETYLYFRKKWRFHNTLLHEGHGLLNLNAAYLKAFFANPDISKKYRFLTINASQMTKAKLTRMKNLSSLPKSIQEAKLLEEAYNCPKFSSILLRGNIYGWSVQDFQNTLCILNQMYKSVEPNR